MFNKLIFILSASKVVASPMVLFTLSPLLHFINEFGEDCRPTFQSSFPFDILEVEQGRDANLSEVFSVTREHGGQGEGLWRQTAWV